MCYPWLLAGCVDSRRIRADKQIIAGAFREAPEETLGFWFGKKMHDSVESSDDLFFWAFGRMRFGCGRGR